MLDRYTIPGAAQDSLTQGGCDDHGRGSGGGLWWPSVAVDAENTLYVTFTCPTPFDVDADTIEYLTFFSSLFKDKLFTLAHFI